VWPVTDDAVLLADPSLRYTSDSEPGYGRRRAGRGFVYLDLDRARLDDEDELARVKALAIPPAWTDVWICPDARGHLQATGRDSKGRKVYRYHTRFREVRERAKFDRLADFGDVLGSIRHQVADDLARPGLSREKVLAAVVRLLELTMIRVGNEEYAKENRSYGLTTLRARHAQLDGDAVRFTFKGKSGREHRVTLRDRRLARIVGRCQELPGQLLFQYVDDDGATGTVTSTDVNDYLRSITEIDVTAKDFRTWTATLLAASTLVRTERPDSDRRAAQRLKTAIEAVADQLGNTVAVCRASYVHPTVVETWLDGTLGPRWERGPKRPAGGLLSEERKLLALLRSEERKSRKRRARRAA
jgi:DNA topoisomerase-1